MHLIVNKNIAEMEEKILKLNDGLYEEAQNGTNSEKFKIL